MAAVTASGISIASNVESITTSLTDLEVNLSWAPVAGTTSYNVYRSTTLGSFPATSLLTTTAAGTTTYIDTGEAVLTAGTVPGVNVSWSSNPNTLIGNLNTALTTLLGANNFNVSMTSPIIAVYPNSRLIANGVISDNLNRIASPFVGIDKGVDLFVDGGGELLMTGTNTYNGTTYVNQGTLTIQNGQAWAAQASMGSRKRPQRRHRRFNDVPALLRSQQQPGGAERQPDGAHHLYGNQRRCQQYPDCAGQP